MKGIEQGRAEKAYKFAQTVKEVYFDKSKNEDGKEAKKYKSYVKKIPMMIKTNGLGASLAFVFSKQNKPDKPKNAYRWIYEQLTQWLTLESKITESYFNKTGDLVQHIISKESSEYRAITVETLALFNWLRRFAEGLIQGEADNND